MTDARVAVPSRTSSKVYGHLGLSPHVARQWFLNLGREESRDFQADPCATLTDYSIITISRARPLHAE